MPPGTIILSLLIICPLGGLFEFSSSIISEGVLSSFDCRIDYEFFNDWLLKSVLGFCLLFLKSLWFLRFPKLFSRWLCGIIFFFFIYFFFSFICNSKIYWTNTCSYWSAFYSRFLRILSFSSFINLIDIF